MKAQDIKHENGNYWVAKDKNCYTVFKSIGTHSISDSFYKMDEDGLSIAVARCNYLAGKL